MKLLIVTQTVDRRDPVLGFFHRWIEEFAKQCTDVTVIGQKNGGYSLPPNVHALTLGKEHGVPLWRQVIRFWHLIGSVQYDAALIHMTPIWVVLGWPFWLLRRKPVYLWYEARGARWPLRFALMIVRKVFSASKSGMPVATSKSVFTGHGIDTDLFQPGSAERDIPLITVGRITKSKRIPVLQKAASTLQKPLLLVGPPDHPVTQNELIPLLQRSSIFLHASETSLDKAPLEAMSCGCIVVSSAEAFRGVLPAQCVCADDEIAETVRRILDMPEEQKQDLRAQLRDIVIKDHSLPHLIDLLVGSMRG